MSQINYLSQLVVGDMNDRSRRESGDNVTPVFFDPATAIVIGKASIELIGILKRCRKEGDSSKEVRMILNDPDNENRIRKYIRRSVRKKIGFRKSFSKEAKEMGESIYNVGTNLSLKGIDRLMEEV